MDGELKLIESIIVHAEDERTSRSWADNDTGWKNLDRICDAAQRLKELLKEQEAVKPKTGHWIFESAYYEAWSHTCSECGKRMTTAYNTYANYCWNCGAKMER